MFGSMNRQVVMLGEITRSLDAHVATRTKSTVSFNLTSYQLGRLRCVRMTLCYALGPGLN